MIDGRIFFACFLLAVGLILLFAPIPPAPLEEEDDDFWTRPLVEDETVIPIRGTNAKKRPNPASVVSIEDFTEETVIAPILEDFYEPQAEKETEPCTEAAVEEEGDQGHAVYVQETDAHETQVETEVASAAAVENKVLETSPDIITDASFVLPVQISLPEYLRQQLAARGLDWFWPYAYAQVMQESLWNPNAVNPNGLDKGLLQYRETSPDGSIPYWDITAAKYGVYASIFDPYAQIKVYVSQVEERANSGLSVEAIISRHITSDYVTTIDWAYVNAVLSHMN